MEAITVNRYVEVICPVCKSKDVIKIPKSVINNATNLTTVSVQKGKICPHHFQLFLDKNFAIRGYQKVDFQINNDQGAKLDKFDPKEHFVNSLELYNTDDLDKNKVKTAPKKRDSYKNKKFVNIKTNSKSKMSLKEVYDEFWEFIDENNEIFRKFILKDKRRRVLLGMHDFAQKAEHPFIEISPKG